MATEAEVLEKVRGIIVEALSADEDEVTPQAKLFADLDAESIDMLDIVFRLEKAFGIKVTRSEMMAEELFDPEKGFVKDGVFTPEGLAEAARMLPWADVSVLGPNARVENFRDIVTVQMIVNFVLTKLKAA